jgi:hypothetical protein
VGRDQALEIALRHCVPPPASASKILDEMPENAAIYNAPKEPCWWVYVPWGDGLDEVMLRASRVIVVSKASGKVLYDGSAGDEG